MDRKEFDLLTTIALQKGTMTQRELSEKLGYSLGAVNKTLKDLSGKGLIAAGAITPAGQDALEPYRAKRAVFLAAGVGSRLMPVSLNTPKPLVRVKGKRMIDGLIDAVLAAGITEIYIVRGYFSDQFDQLLYKYPMIHFIENPDYMETNDISSAVCAKYHLSNAYVFESDIILYKPELIRKYHYTSDFLGFYKDRSDDWCFEVQKKHITEEKFGGFKCYQMVGISYWNEADGKRLASHLPEAYGMPGGKDKYWEQVPLTVFQEQYHVELLECGEEDVTEIDTFRELKAVDPAYGAYK